MWGQWAQDARLALEPGFKLLRWPKGITERGPWFLYGLFVAILIWEELWDLPNSATLSASLLLLITGGAVATSLFFEQRLWCRSLCPIGGMNGQSGLGLGLGLAN